MAKVTPAAVALPPTMVPDDTGLLSAVTGAAYRSKSVALVNFSTAPPPDGKAALYAVWLVTLEPVMTAVDGLPGLRAVVNESGVADSWKL